MDGIEAACAIWDAYKIPIIFLTAYADDDTLNQAAHAEPYAYLVKPFDDKDLRSSIQIALHKHQISEELRTTSGQLEAVLRGTSSGIYMVDAAGMTTYANAQMASICGYSSVEALLEASPDDLLRSLPVCDEMGNRVDEKELPAQWALRGTDPQITILRVENPPHASDRWLQVNAVPVLDKWGAVESAVMTVHDITEAKLAEQEQETLISDLEAYAHTVAHDLKNPLATIYGFVEEIRLSNLSREALEEYYEIISSRAMKAVQIIDELLLLARVQSLVDFEPQPLQFDQIMQEAIERLEPLIETTQTSIEAPEHWPAMLGHRAWVEEVIVNYLSNAIRYGGAPPQIVVEYEQQPESQTRINIRDNGPGLSPADQSVLFNMFTRSEHSRPDGHGLGLSIVRRIVSRLGGMVGVDSAPGQGSTFWFSLPTAPQELAVPLSSDQEA
jgi:PAS domain S-box-containing protein